MKLSPKVKQWWKRKEKFQRFLLSRWRIGDVFVVRPGENIPFPVDGIVLEGNSAVN